MLRICVVLMWYTIVHSKDSELPLCPANIQYLPQNLPMHCRMPVKVEQKNPFQLPPGFQIMQGMQGLPGAPMPVAVPGPPAAAPVLPGLPPPPMPMQPMPGIPGLAAPMIPQKLPVVVMPYYSPVASKKDPERKRYRYRKSRRNMYVSDETSDVDSNGSLSEEDDVKYNGRRHLRDKRRKLKLNKQMLTPLLQYVTKDGYVIYEKKISNREAKKWLSNDEDKDDRNKENDSQEHLKEPKNLKFKEFDKQKLFQARKMSKSSGKN